MAEGLSPNPEKVEDIVNFPIPKTISQLRGFLGLASFYRRFVPSFANISRPLVNLLKKGTDLEWELEEQAAFDTLKRKLSEPPVLIHSRSRSFKMIPQLKFILMRQVWDWALYFVRNFREQSIT